MPVDRLGAGGIPEFFSLVFSSNSSVPRTASLGAGVDGGTYPSGVSGTLSGVGSRHSDV